MALPNSSNGLKLNTPFLVRALSPSSYGTETDGSDLDIPELNDPHGRNGAPRKAPALFHKVQNKKSILTLAASESKLFAGTQGGELLIWSLETYELLTNIAAHSGAVLSLCLSEDGKLLFSSAGDAIVNVWNTENFSRLYSIYSNYDVGDVFCVVYSSTLETIYIGAQNTSIQWYDLSRKDARPAPNLGSHPSQRNHRFFDSKGPGGVTTPRPTDKLEFLDHGGQTLEIDKTNIIQYAHYGYVYCMVLCTGLEPDTNRDMLVTGGGDGTIKLWHLKNESGSAVEEAHVLENGDNSILSMALNNTLLYAGRLEGEVNVWDLETRQLIQTFSAYKADVLTISVGLGLIFTGGADGRAKIFERYRCKNEWEAHAELILASTVITHKDQPYLITGGNDDCVAIWDLSDSFTIPAKRLRPNNEQLVRSLERFVGFRTVSSKPEYADDCRQGASWLRNLFKRYGAATNMLNTKDNHNPVVHALFKGKKPGGKRILFYGHYDVIPAENEQSKWVTEPFVMEGRNGYLYGRGVTDNKGPVLAALYAVADLVAEQKLESDIVFLIEGEEESGSRGFEETVRQNKEIIGQIDWILLANSYWLNDDIPCLTYGLRGVVHATINVEGGQKDLHSGVNGSQLMDEPLKDLVLLMAKLTGHNGSINIPGFYDQIMPVTPAEDKRYKAINDILLRNNSENEDAESLKARWREPSLTMHGFKTSGAGNSTIIPHLASIQVSFRLVPNQSAATIQADLIEYLHAQFETLNTSNRITISTGNPADPWLGDPENEIYSTLQDAIVDVWNLAPKIDPNLPGEGEQVRESTNKPKPTRTKNRKSVSNSVDIIPPKPSTATESQKPLYIREGGSIPIIRFLEKEFNAPAAQLPCGQSSDSAHLDNERIRLLNLYNSRKIFKRVFKELPLRRGEREMG